MNAAEREEMRRQTREVADWAYAAYRRGQRILVWGIIGGILAAAIGFGLSSEVASMAVHHTGFSWTAAGTHALIWLGSSAAFWNGFWLWDRWRRRR